MMDRSLTEMRDFMSLTESLVDFDEEPVALIEQPAVRAPLRSIFEDLKDAVFKMRAFTESRDGDLGLGVELGMQRAADMVENVINRYQVEDENIG